MVSFQHPQAEVSVKVKLDAETLSVDVTDDEQLQV